MTVAAKAATAERSEQAAKLLASARHALSGGGIGAESKAVRAATEALELFRVIGNQPALAQTLETLAQLHLQAGELQQSLKCAEEALDVFLPMHPRMEEEAQAASCAVEALLQLGQPEAALRAARDAHEAFQEAGLQTPQALMLESMASVYGTAGQLAQAERLARRALRFYAAQPGSAEAEKRVLGAIAAFRLNRGLGPDVGGGSKKEAPVNVFAAASDSRSAAESLYSVAEAHAAAGRAAEVLAEGTALLGRCREARDALAEGIVLLAMATAHLGLNSPSEALQAARDAKELFEAEGELHWWALALAMVAATYSEKGQQSMVQQYGRSAARKFVEAGKRSVEEVHVRLLLVHSLLSGPQAQRRPPEAVKEAEAALALARELGDRRLQVTALGAITMARSSGGQYDEALSAANRALQLLGDDSTQDRAKLLLHCADVFLVLGRFADALGPASEMVDLARADGDAKFVSLAEEMLQKVQLCQEA